MAHSEELTPGFARRAGATLIEEDGKTAAHEVAWPEHQAGSSAPPAPRAGPAAKEYPFSLDPFQRCAINCLETGDPPAGSVCPLICCSRALTLFQCCAAQNYR